MLESREVLFEVSVGSREMNRESSNYIVLQSEQGMGNE